MKKTVSIILTVMLIISLTVTNAIGSSSKMNQTYAAGFISVTSWQELKNAVENGSDNVNVRLDKNIVGPESTEDIEVAAGKTVVFDLNGCTLDRARVKDGNNKYSLSRPLGRAFTVYGNLTINDSKDDNDPKGISPNTGMITNCNSEGAIYVANGGTFTLNAGMIGGDGKGNFGNVSRFEGAGVLVKGGTFIMNGGKIFNNRAENTQVSFGGGVSIREKSTFIMTGGTIGRNLAKIGGGVYVSDSDFTMKGGFIGFYGNQSRQDDGSGGVYVESGTFTMTGGEIGNNLRGGVLVGQSAQFTLKGGRLKSNDNAGLTVEGLASIEGGFIGDENVVGVKVLKNGTCYMKDGSIIGNILGGVEVDGDKDTSEKDPSLFHMLGGNISDNTSVYDGAGVKVINGAKFIMSDGKITNNFAREDNIDGGGVFVDGEKSELAMLGGEISGNAVTNGYGGGVYVGKDASMGIAGTPVIKDNCQKSPAEVTNNIHLCGNIKMLMGEKLMDGASLGVSVSGSHNKVLTAGYSNYQKLEETSDEVENPSKFFISDDTRYHVGINQSNEVVLCNENLVSHEAKPATCTEDGNVAYYECGTCKGLYLDAEGRKGASKAEIFTPATGHDWGEPSFSWSTDYTKCTATRVCKNEANHTEIVEVEASTVNVTPSDCTKNGSEIKLAVFGFSDGTYCSTTNSIKIGAAGHTKSAEATIDNTNNYKAATCTEDGHHDEYYTCTKCGVELDRHTVVDPALGHNWGNVSYSWNGDNSECTAIRKCSRADSHVEKETVKAIERIIKKPSCEDKGTKVKTAIFVNPVFEPQTVTEDIKKTGHDWGEPSYTWGDNGLCEAVRVCNNDNSHFEQETVDAGKDVIKAATCTADGEIKYTAKFANHIFETQTKTDVLKATGHNWGLWTVTKEATESEEGVATRVCKNDASHTETKSIPKKAATPAPDYKAAIDEKIINQKGEDDLKDSDFTLLMAKGVPASKTSVKLTWKKMKAAKEYIVYGNKCGVKNKYKRITSVTTNKYIHKNCKVGTYYKFLVVAVDGEGNILATSKTIHCVTNGGKAGNNTKVVLNKKKVTLKKGKSVKLTAKLKSKKPVHIHRNIAWESDNPKVATVTKNGKIKAVGKGSCTVYAYAQNGVYAKVKVKAL